VPTQEFISRAKRLPTTEPGRAGSLLFIGKMKTKCEFTKLHRPISMVSSLFDTSNLLPDYIVINN